MSIVLKAIGILLTWLPLVIKVVREVEVLLSDRPGEEKKEAAMRLIKEAFAARGISLTKENMNMISGLIDFAVGLLDAIRAWRKPQVTSKLVSEGRLPQ